jgi:ribulose-phosphate 3-epimerase
MSGIFKRPAADWFERLPTERLMAEISLWSADLGRLEADLERVEAGADLFHIDVADGHFAPALLFFPDLVARLRVVTAKPFHVHLMTADAVLISQIAQFAEAGADLVSVHVENANAGAALAAIRAAGLRAGLVWKLETPIASLASWLEKIDFATLLGTRLGVKGQRLAEEAPARVRQARAMIEASGRPIVLAADGGIREETAPSLRAAGAASVVMGSLAFGAPDFMARIAWLRALERA